MGETTSSSFIDYNIDPDLNLLAADIQCQYYDQDEFMNTFNSNTNTKLLHINARSLPKKYIKYCSLFKVAANELFNHRGLGILVRGRL